MKFSALYRTYGALRAPGFTLTADGAALPVGEASFLRALTCELTCESKAGSLHLEAVLGEGEAWSAALLPGAAVRLALGYGALLEPVFSGFVCETRVRGAPGRAGTSLEIDCLDALGRLMQCARADAGAARLASVAVTEMLTQPAVAALAATRRVDAPPEGWDLPLVRGATDFDTLRSLAELFCYEFYACGDELCFGAARPVSEPCVTFDGGNGLLSVERVRSLAGQAAAVTVGGADGTGARVSFRAARARDACADAVTGELAYAEPSVRTMEQARYLAEARMARLSRRADGLKAKGAGLPALRPGRFVALRGVGDAWDGAFYLRTVRHRLDETGFETEWEAEG